MNEEIKEILLKIQEQNIIMIQRYEELHAEVQKLGVTLNYQLRDLERKIYLESHNKEELELLDSSLFVDDRFKQITADNMEKSLAIIYREVADMESNIERIKSIS